MARRDESPFVNGTEQQARQWPLRDAVLTALAFAVIYLATRPQLMISDGASWTSEALIGDPARTWYGFPSYFLQIPLAHAVWRMLAGLGVPVTVVGVYLSISLAGTLAAIVFVGRIAALVLEDRRAGLIAAILFGASVNPWTQWNGELSGLAIGLMSAGLFYALRGQLLAPAVLWALSTMAQINFVLATPAFVAAVWMSRRNDATTAATAMRSAALPVIAGLSSAILFAGSSWLAGKWHQPHELPEWLQRSFQTADRAVMEQPNPARALKGLATAFSAAGHVLRDVFTGRGAFDEPYFSAAFAAACVFAVVTIVLLGYALERRRALLLALVWLLPFHVGFNWWWAPTEEEYHTGALPGVVLLATAGLLALGSRMSAPRRQSLVAAYLVFFAGLNFFTVIVPRKMHAAEAVRAGTELRAAADAAEGRMVLVTCDGGNVPPVQRSGIEYLRIRSIWRAPVPEIQQEIDAWVRAKIREGKSPYLLGRWCWPENWRTTWSKAPFDLYFLKSSFSFGAPTVLGIPTDAVSVTDPFTWKRGDVVPLTLKDGANH